MSRKDPLRLIEAAYSFVPDEEAWLAGIAEAARPYEIGGGVAAYVSEFGEHPRVRSIASQDLLLDPALVHELPRAFPEPVFRRAHAPMPAAYSDDFWPALAADVQTAYPDLLGQFPFAHPPAWALCGGDADLETALVVFHYRDPRGASWPHEGHTIAAGRDAMPLQDQRVLSWFAAHLGSALRLRSVLRRAPTADDDAAEAVLSPDGKLLDARRGAEDERGSLIDAVLRSERAQLRRAPPEERLELWTALVEGRWSILESTERDGKRLLLAYRNEPRTATVRSLTTRERTIVQYAALGHPFKYIAYEMGMPLKTVAGNLKVALRKLGLRSRAELIRCLAGAARDAIAAGAARDPQASPEQ